MNIEIDVNCNICGAGLEVYGGSDRFGDPKISVVPCESCTKEAVEEARAEFESVEG